MKNVSRPEGTTLVFRSPTCYSPTIHIHHSRLEDSSNHTSFPLSKCLTNSSIVLVSFEKIFYTFRISTNISTFSSVTSTLFNFYVLLFYLLYLRRTSSTLSLFRIPGFKLGSFLSFFNRRFPFLYISYKSYASYNCLSFHLNSCINSILE